jgi:hypothetical protein
MDRPGRRPLPERMAGIRPTMRHAVSRRSAPLSKSLAEISGLRHAPDIPRVRARLASSAIPYQWRRTPQAGHGVGAWRVCGIYFAIY